MPSEPLDLRVTELRGEMEGLSKLADSFGQKLVTGLAGAVVHGRKLSDVMRSIGLSLANQALSQALRPLGNIVGGLFGQLFANANGNVLSQGRIVPFANGGVINSPLLFPMRGGTGLAGEAGPEAIMPLARGSDGKLGVRGGGGARVTVNISTPDVQGFRQSRSQIAAMMTRALAQGQRNS
jgi:lambda family phage tail tape measure protein